MSEQAVQSENAPSRIDFGALRAQLEPNIAVQTALIQETYAITDPKMLMSIIEAKMDGIRPLATTLEALASPEMHQERDALSAAQSIIQQYSNYPGVSQAFAAMVTANSQNPELLETLAREMVDQIEQVKSNPHVHHPVNPAIAQAVEAVREVELQKPDPLNLLRGEPAQPEKEPQAKTTTLAELFTAPIMDLVKKEEPAVEVARPSNPFAAALAGSSIANEFKAALDNMTATEPAARTGQVQEQQRDGWVR